ncbi:hypothetical protein H2200_001254 [Cladophialophora chaetospira]|uniref:Uncharacterized protein n=1 Tax=Cladophialophora chaetospira TaxID=386627 RepID=A0AA38XKT5_9EURO|nr:hypothetical protein H2200_001254 [Cladophialophora chaetospira]
MFTSLRPMLFFCFQLFISAILSQGFLEVDQITQRADFQGLTLENLAVRSNNQILVTTSSPHASLYQISPSHAYPPVKVASFPNVKAAHGIVELTPNKFYVIGTDSTISKTVPKSSHVFEVDMTSFRAANGNVVRPAKVHKVADLPRASFPSDVTVTLSSSTVILVADERAGHVWRVDISTGEVTQIREDASMSALGGTGVGINGIKVVQSCGNRYLYYTNTSKKSLYQALIKPLGAIDGPPQTLLGGIAYSDFDVDSNGVVYLTSSGGGLYNVGAGPSAGDDSQAPSSLVDQGALAGATSVRFGRGNNKQILYVTTNTKAGGSVSSVDTSGILSTNSC